MSENGDLDARGRRNLHIALAGILVMLLSPLVSMWAALQLPKGSRWRRWVLALAGFDLVLCVGLLATGATKASPEEAPSSGRPRIGVTLQPASSEEGVGIASVHPGSPAEQAGVRAGDRVRSVDDQPVDQAAFTKVIADTPEGASRHLRVQRGGETLDIQVTPQSHWKGAPKAPPSSPADRDAFSSSAPLFGLLAVATSLLILAALAWRRGVPPWLALGVLAGTALPSVVSMAMASAGPGSLIGSLVAALVGTLLMLLVAALCVKRAPALSASAPMRSLPAFAWSLFYTLTGSARAWALVAVLQALSRGRTHSPAEVFGDAFSSGPVAMAVFVVAGAVVAPIAEELLFRGVLLPWLASWMRPAVAVIVSAGVFGLGHLYYGLGVLVPVVYGLVLGWLRLRTGRLGPCVALHMLFNTLATIGLLLR